MLWIKRNLFIVIGAIVSVVLLGGSGYYVYDAFYDNDDQDVELEKLNAELQGFQAGFFPSQENIGILRSNTALAEAFMRDASRLLVSDQPRPLTAATFTVELVKTLDRLRRDATNASVELPPRFDFAFGEIKLQSRPLAYAVEPLNNQLADISALCGVLYQAKVRGLDSLQRVPAYAGDPASQDLLLDLSPRTNVVSTNLTLVSIPYRIVFRGFVAELTAVLNGLARTKEFIAVRQLDLEAGGAVVPSMTGVDPAMMDATGGMAPGMAPMAGLTPGGGLAPPQGLGLAPGGVPGAPQPGMLTPGGIPAAPRPAQPVRPANFPGGAVPPPPKSTLTPILDERPLRVTLVVDVIKTVRRPVTPAATPAVPAKQ